ncbi:hypothetical protein MAR_027602 [Mya arenaria]|uniref:Uncharacterized protein n=1 Tax=Mya arenaria TaxID=6604 RepID=A0ABY7EX09_MYAAR|nr:hypothetical protein MAR_027602 [Mya arenaria]
MPRQDILIATDVWEGVVKFYYKNGSEALKPRSFENEAPYGVCIYDKTAQPQGGGQEDAGLYHRAIVINTGRKLCLVDIRAISNRGNYSASCFYELPASEPDNITLMELNMHERHVYFVIGTFMYRVAIDAASTQSRYLLIESSYNITALSWDYADEALYYIISSSPPQIWDMDPNDPQHVTMVHQAKTGENPHNMVVVPHLQ